LRLRVQNSNDPHKNKGTFSLFVSLVYCAESTVRWFVVREKHCWIAADSADKSKRTGRLTTHLTRNNSRSLNEDGKEDRSCPHGQLMGCAAGLNWAAPSACAVQRSPNSHVNQRNLSVHRLRT
jgi:hypothetical protein